MILKIKILIIILLSLPIIFSFNFSPENKSIVGVNYHLAFSINPAQNSGYINFAIIGENNGKIVYSKFITIHEFILVGMGKQTSPANEIGVNLFDKYEIKECLYKYDSAQCKKKDEMNLHDLWTLRYNRNPFCPPDCVPADGMVIEGFGQHKAHPSWPQLQILQQYGVIYINDFFYGENMFKLFADFQKTDWINKYISSLDP